MNEKQKPILEKAIKNDNMNEKAIKKIDGLKRIIETSNNIVFFGGAGVSTESGISDFRSENGIKKTVELYGDSPEIILSHEYFFTKTEEFYKYYKENIIHKSAKPNYAHLTISELENKEKIKAVITQNIDGLHQKAGSENVLELHGTITKNYCENCKAEYNLDYIINSKNIPLCEKCGEIVKPDVVLYQEPLNNDIMNKSIEYISNAETLIIGGTSLVVYPAAGLIQHFNGKNLILINKSKTPYDNYANLVINESIGEVFKKIL
jgi:NAD-dependent deacetylase